MHYWLVEVKTPEFSSSISDDGGLTRSNEYRDRVHRKNFQLFSAEAEKLLKVLESLEIEGILRLLEMPGLRHRCHLLRVLLAHPCACWASEMLGVYDKALESNSKSFWPRNTKADFVVRLFNGPLDSEPWPTRLTQGGPTGLEPHAVGVFGHRYVMILAYA